MIFTKPGCNLVNPERIMVPINYIGLSYRPLVVPSSSVIPKQSNVGFEGAKHIPMFVYENSISDSVHTANRLVLRGSLCKENSYALFPMQLRQGHGKLEHNYGKIYSASIYNCLFAWVCGICRPILYHDNINAC